MPQHWNSAKLAIQETLSSTTKHASNAMSWTIAAAVCVPTTSLPIIAVSVALIAQAQPYVLHAYHSIFSSQQAAAGHAYKLPLLSHAVTV